MAEEARLENQEAQKSDIEYHGPKTLKDAVGTAVTNSKLHLSRKVNIEVGVSSFGVDYEQLGFANETVYFEEIDKRITQMDDLKRLDEEISERRINEEEGNLSKLVDEGNLDEYMRILGTKGEGERQIEEKLLTVNQEFMSIGDKDAIKHKNLSLETPIEELRKLEDTTLGGYDGLEDKIVFDPSSVYGYKSGLSKEAFESTARHELTHNELGDAEPYKISRENFVRAKILQENKDLLASQNPDVMKRLDEFFASENGKKTEQAYADFSSDRREVAEIGGLSRGDTDFLEKFLAISNEVDALVEKIQRTKNSNGLHALDEGLAWAVTEEEPDFSIYATKDTPEDMYTAAYSICKSLLKEMPYEKVVQTVKNVMNKSFREGKNAVELLKAVS